MKNIQKRIEAAGQLEPAEARELARLAAWGLVNADVALVRALAEVRRVVDAVSNALDRMEEQPLICQHGKPLIDAVSNALDRMEEQPLICQHGKPLIDRASGAQVFCQFCYSEPKPGSDEDRAGVYHDR